MQKRAARFVTNYYRTGPNSKSVTEIVNKLNWLSLEVKRERARFILFYKNFNNILKIYLDLRLLGDSLFLSDRPSLPRLNVDLLLLLPCDISTLTLTPHNILIIQMKKYLRNIELKK